MLFGQIHSVSEETVKSWEARAIATLAQALTTKPSERPTDVEAVFWVASGRIRYKWVASFWQQGDLCTTRLDGQELFVRRRQLTMSFAAYQLGLEERPTSLTIDVIFVKEELPTGTFGFGGTDLFEFITGNYEPQTTNGPQAGVHLLQDLRIDAYEVFRDSSYFQLRWFDPEPLKIYGVAWY